MKIKNVVCAAGKTGFFFDDQKAIKLGAKNDGAVRLLDTGNLPFLPSLLEFHKNKLEERGKFENRPVNFQMVIDDVYAIGKGVLVGRPSNKKK